MNSPDGFSSLQTPDPGPAPLRRFRNRRDEFDARPKLGPWKRIPVGYRILLILLVIGVAAATFHAELFDLYHRLRPATARVMVVDFDGNPIPMRGRADIFQLDRSLFMPSPMPRVGSVQLDEEMEDLVLGDAAYPRSLQVRFHVPGYGVDFTSVELGKRRPFRLRLGRPMEVKGRITDVNGAAIAGARVVALGGSSRGVVLEEAETRADGAYTLAAISEYVDYLTLRILKEGYALEEREYWKDSRSKEQRQTDFQLVPVPPVQGEVVLPADLQTGSLRVSVLNLAGVCGDVGRDGKFALHHLSAGGRYRVLLRGLPNGYTHRETYVQPGQRVEIEVVPAVTLRGKVFSERFRRPIERVELWHTNSTRGSERCVTDGYGRFALPNVPTGRVRLRVVAPDSYFGGGTTERVLEVETKHGTDPVSIRIH